MEAIIRFFSEIDAVYAALLATTFTWLVTAMGASLVFFFKTMHRGVLDGMLGFTGGVMVAASFWSLLNPSIELSEKMYPGYMWMPQTIHPLPIPQEYYAKLWPKQVKWFYEAGF